MVIIKTPIIDKFLIIAPISGKANTWIINVVGIKNTNSIIGPKLLSFLKIKKQTPIIINTIELNKKSEDKDLYIPAEFMYLEL